jgi:protein ImuB
MSPSPRPSRRRAPPRARHEESKAGSRVRCAPHEVGGLHTPTRGAAASHAPGPIVAVELSPVAAVQAAWRAEPCLRSAPLAIVAPGGPVQAVCPLAAAAGIVPGQGVTQARLCCPDVMMRALDRAAIALLYDDLLVTLSAMSPVVEAANSAAGLAYLDARGLERLWGDPAAVARKALQALAARDLAARAGAGPARVVALTLARRMGAEGPRALAEPEARAFLHALPIDDPTLGLLPATATALRELGITTAGALAALPLAGVALRFGPDAIAAHHSVASAADPPLHPWRPPDSLAVEHRVEAGISDAMVVQALLRRLSDWLAVQLVERGQAAATLTLHVACENGARLAQRAYYGTPLQAAPTLAAAALDLLARSRLTAPVEALALRATDLRRPDARQRGLWDDQTVDRRHERLAAAMAAHAQRYGQGRLRRLRRDPLAADGWVWEEAEDVP